MNNYLQILTIFSKSIKKAVIMLQRGGIIVYPTDTAYALGADPQNKKAIAKIYKIKGRSKNKALPMIAASILMVRRFFKLSSYEAALAKKYWPGPLSVVLETRNKRPGTRRHYSHILKNMRIVRLVVRVPANNVAREISRQLGRPIVSTSANISGQGECYSAAQVYKQFKNRKHQPDLILNGGRLSKRKPSTIIKADQKGRIFVLRKGSVKI